MLSSLGDLTELSTPYTSCILSPMVSCFGFGGGLGSGVYSTLDSGASPFMINKTNSVMNVVSRVSSDSFSTASKSSNLNPEAEIFIPVQNDSTGCGNLGDLRSLALTGEHTFRFMLFLSFLFFVFIICISS